MTRRLSFNARADEYRLARPPYPNRVYDLLAQRCGLGPGTRIVEIGAGTGQATRALVARRLFGSFPNVNELSAPDRLAFLDSIESLVDTLGGTVLDPHISAVYLAPRR